MIPVSDTVRSRTTPYVNVALILVNAGVFIYELTLSQLDVNLFFIDHGVIPARLVHWVEGPSGLGQPPWMNAEVTTVSGWPSPDGPSTQCTSLAGMTP